MGQGLCLLHAVPPAFCKSGLASLKEMSYCLEKPFPISIVSSSQKPDHKRLMAFSFKLILLGLIQAATSVTVYQTPSHCLLFKGNGKNV